VDLNPHQIEAALFAMRSPISKGVLLADEVGLGKTIEAGLAICQHWAERRRRILVICPASIRKQWALELDTKFHLPTTVLDARTCRQITNEGNPSPFVQDRIVICSMHFASSRATEVKPIQWDLVVIDEAHKLRNAYRQSNKMGQNVRWALEDRRKVLVTATPLQNSLLELYGLSYIIDEYLFGDLPSYRTKYVNAGGDLDELRDRLKSFCTRTLRSQVVEYIQYTERRLITRPFEPTDHEYKLYEAVSDFLKREDRRTWTLASTGSWLSPAGTRLLHQERGHAAGRHRGGIRSTRRAVPVQDQSPPPDRPQDHRLPGSDRRLPEEALAQEEVRGRDELLRHPKEADSLCSDQHTQSVSASRMSS
jgi:SNF2 family DNA or RNA helicase